MRRDEHLLQYVLRVLRRGEHPAAEREQPRLITLEERLERSLLPLADQCDQALVALQPQQR